MKKIIFTLLFLAVGKSHAQVPAQALYDHYSRVRASIKAGQFDRLDAQVGEFTQAYPSIANYLAQGVIDQNLYDQRGRSFITGTHVVAEAVEDVIFNTGMVGLAGPQSAYFNAKANITAVRVKNFLNLAGFAIKDGKIANRAPSADQYEAYYRQSIANIIALGASAHWQGNHDDSYTYDAPQGLISAYAVMTNEFGANFNTSYFTAETLAQLQSRRLGRDELWTEPLDMIAEVVRRSTYLQTPLYHEIDPRDYFFYIQDNFARVFGANDVNDAVELSVGNVNSQKQVILLCNARTMSVTPGGAVRDRGTSLMVNTIVTPWDSFRSSTAYACGQKSYAVTAQDQRFNAVAPLPRIVRIDPRVHNTGFNVLLSYIYYADMPENVVQNLINAMVQQAGYTYQGETPIANSKTALINGLNSADMFFRVGHVSGDNLNISFTQGRELRFTRVHEGTTINFIAQIPMPTNTGSSLITRQELAGTLWHRSANGRAQSLYAQGIACRSATYINTWMEAYFEAVMSHSNHPGLIDEQGAIHNFDPPFVVGASNTFNSSTHRDSPEGLQSFLQIILIALNHTISSDPRYHDATTGQDTLRTEMFRALAANSTPYIAESNHSMAHTRQMSSRLNIRLVFGDEVIDRVYTNL